MKYKTVGTRQNHKVFVRERETNFDVKRHSKKFPSKGLNDHTKMKGHEFAAFQKRMFQQMKRDKQRYKIVLFATVIVTLLVIIGFLLFWDLYDFGLLSSSEF